MNNVSFKNAYINQTTSPEIQKRIDNGENFGAIDKEQLKQDAVDLSTKAKDAAKENVKENFIFRIMRNMGSEDPKKTLKSIFLTLGTVIGVSILGNKLVGKTAHLGLKVDDFFLNQKWYTNISNRIQKSKGNLVNTLKTKSTVLNDVITTLSDKTKRAKPKADLTRGYGQGFRSIFALTPIDIMQKGFKDVNTAEKALKKIVGEKEARNFAQQLFPSEKGVDIKDKIAFCEEFSDAIRKYNNCGDDNKKFLQVLEQLKEGIAKGNNPAPEFTDIVMCDKMKFTLNPLELGGHLLGDWWHVTLIDKIGRKIRGPKWKPFGRGNLGDSLIKFNSVDGKLAKTIPGKIVQNSILVPAESIGNHSNDKSGMGVILCGTIMSLYNNMQDAPEGKKASLVANDFVGTIGSIAITTPLAFKTTYALASLANIEGKSLLSKPIKLLGKIFNMGLPDGANVFARKAGGLLRFMAIMFVFTPFFSKPVEAAIHKVLGKPYNKAEEEQKKQLELQRQQIVPELGITQGELEQKIKNNPKALEQLSTNPDLAKAINNNPKLLLDLLDNKPIDVKSELAKPKNNKPNKLSPVNKKYIDSHSELFRRKNKTNTQQDVKNNTSNVDTATYIPTSDNNATNYTISQEQLNHINEITAKADKALSKAEQVLADV